MTRDELGRKTVNYLIPNTVVQNRIPSRRRPIAWDLPDTMGHEGGANRAHAAESPQPGRGDEARDARNPAWWSTCRPSSTKATASAWTPSESPLRPAASNNFRPPQPSCFSPPARMRQNARRAPPPEPGALLVFQKLFARRFCCPAARSKASGLVRHAPFARGMLAEHTVKNFVHVTQLPFQIEGVFQFLRRQVTFVTLASFSTRSPETSYQCPTKAHGIFPCTALVGIISLGIPFSTEVPAATFQKTRGPWRGFKIAKHALRETHASG